MIEKKDLEYIKQLIFTLNETIERWYFQWMIIHPLLGKVQKLTHKNNYPILQRMGEVTPNYLEWKQGAHN